MLSFRCWFKRPRPVGEPVYAALDTEDQERQLVTAVRRELCNRWWRSVGCVNNGALTEREFNRFVLREKRIWWRWNFGEPMPE
jgi:hypothetical protein